MVRKAENVMTPSQDRSLTTSLNTRKSSSAGRNISAANHLTSWRFYWVSIFGVKCLDLDFTCQSSTVWAGLSVCTSCWSVAGFNQICLTFDKSWMKRGILWGLRHFKFKAGSYAQIRGWTRLIWWTSVQDLVTSSGEVADCAQMKSVPPTFPFQACKRTYSGHETHENVQVLFTATVWFVLLGYCRNIVAQYDVLKEEELPPL